MSNYPFFPQEELNCPCGCDGRMDDVFMSTIVSMRSQLGFPMEVPSGGAYRCEEYDKKTNGAHSHGRALDIVCNSRRRFMVLGWIFDFNRLVRLGMAEGRPITRIGINNGAIHIDDMGEDDGKDERVIWDYYG